MPTTRQHAQAGLVCFFTMLVSVNAGLGLVVAVPERASGLAHTCALPPDAKPPVHIASGKGQVLGASYVFEVVVNNLSHDVASWAMDMLVETFIVPYTAFKRSNAIWKTCVAPSSSCF